MDTLTYITLLLFALNFIISLIIAAEFYYSRNGTLRRLLIFLFISLAWRAIIAGTIVGLNARGFYPVSQNLGRIISLIPLSIASLFFLKYIVNKNIKKRRL